MMVLLVTAWLQSEETTEPQIDPVPELTIVEPPLPVVEPEPVTEPRLPLPTIVLTPPTIDIVPPAEVEESADTGGDCANGVCSKPRRGLFGRIRRR